MNWRVATTATVAAIGAVALLGIPSGAVAPLRAEASLRLTRESLLTFVQWTDLGPGSEGATAIYVVRTDGTGLRRLAVSGASPPRWSPDGSKIAYVVGGELYVMNADGRDKRRLSDDVYGGLAWSPGGREITFSLCRPNVPCGIGVVDASGRHVRLIAALPSGVVAWDLDWFPDGRRILIGTSSDGVWTVNSDGEGLKVVMRDWRDCRQPRWSPNGKTLLCVSDEGTRGDGQAIHLFARGRWNKPILRFAATSTPIGGAAWSPDGSRIAQIDHYDTLRIVSASSGRDIQHPVRLRVCKDGCMGLDWRRR